MSEPRRCYFVMEGKRDDDGWIPCIAVENEQGYYPTTWRYDCDFSKAQEIVDGLNARLGLTKQDALKIQLSTMGGNRW